MTYRQITLVPLGDVAEFLGGSTPSRSQKKYFGGDIPWVKTTDLNNGSIYCTEESLTEAGLAESSCKIVPANSVLVAMYGGFRQIGRTGLLKQASAINQALTAIIPDRGKLIPEFLLEWLNFRVHYWKKFAGSSRKDPNITKGDVSDFPVPIIPIKQQIEAVQVLNSWNNAIQTIEQLIQAKELHLAHSRDSLLRKPHQSLRTNLGSVTQELTKRNGGTLGRQAIMAVTKQVGMRPMREETIAANTDRYKLVPPRAFAYNPMRLNIGSIAMSAFKHEVLVSPDYVVFSCEESKLLPAYLHHLRFSRSWKKHFELAGNGGVRVRIYYEYLGTFSFELPSIAVQMRIVDFLDAAAKEISLLNEQAEELRIQKRGLMQKLLTGQWCHSVPANGMSSA